MRAAYGLQPDAPRAFPSRARIADMRSSSGLWDETIPETGPGGAPVNTLDDLGDLAVIAAKRDPAVATQLMRERPLSHLFPDERGGPAFHGSAHKFDKFELEKIGTGEGAQAYGHGLYFAENPGVASSYKNVNPQALQSPLRSFKGRELESGTGAYHAATLVDSNSVHTLPELRKEVQGWIDDAENWSPQRLRDDQATLSGWQETLDTLNDAKSKADFKVEKRTGHLYEVDIHDEQIAKMLDWDAPLSPEVRKILESDPEAAKRLRMAEASFGELTGEQAYEVIAQLPSGGMSRDQAFASRYLNEAGIPGIRFYDGASRSAQEGTRNIVVFNPDDITHVKRDGEVVYEKADAHPWGPKDSQQQESPWIGVLTGDGRHEFRNMREGAEADWHHTNAMKLYDDWEADSTLRFVRDINHGTLRNRIILRGGAVLDPYGKGEKQIVELAKRLKKEGAPGDLEFKVDQMLLGTDFEGKTIGTIDDWATNPQVDWGKQRGSLGDTEGSPEVKKGAANAALTSELRAFRAKTDVLNRYEYIYGDSPAAPANSRRIVDVGLDLQEEALKAWGGKPMELTPENAMIVADNMTAEAAASFGRRPEMSGWYKENLEKAMVQAARIHPELKTDKKAQSGFKFIMSITSNGQEVPLNATLTNSYYPTFRDTGKFKVAGSGKEKAAMEHSFATANQMIDDLGWEGFDDFLDQEFTVKELLDAGFKVSGENVDTVVKGSVIFGPKIGGGFMQNLRGNYDPPTFDRWWQRTYGRHTGTLIADPLKIGTQEEAFFDVLEEVESEAFRAMGMTKKQALENPTEAARVIYANFSKGGFKVKSEVNNSARNLVKSLDNVVDAPAGGVQRAFMRMVIVQVRDNLRAMGISVDTADVQALLWYAEKDLYGKMGANVNTETVDYATVWKQLADQGQGTNALLEGAQ